MVVIIAGWKWGKHVHNGVCVEGGGGDGQGTHSMLGPTSLSSARMAPRSPTPVVFFSLFHFFYLGGGGLGVSVLTKTLAYSYSWV